MDITNSTNLQLGTGQGQYLQSHMPLDIVPHWTLRNPLNVVPASVVLALAVAVAKLLLG
jgi:hypothetical protein